MSQDLIKALEDIAATDEGASGHKASRALSRHRSSVESVELPEPDGFWLDGTSVVEIIERRDYHDGLEWEPIYTATTVRSLIAAAVEREREECAKVCEDRQASYEARGFPREFTAARACAAAIRAARAKP